MILWRLTRRPHADLGGRGGQLADGRWHSRGRPIVYCAASAALAVLEVRVHLDVPLDLLPDDYVLMQIAAPDDLEVRVIRPADLPPVWRSREDICRPIGDDWLAEGSTALLGVPSAIVEVEHNVLLNPGHRDAARVAAVEVTPFGWDERLFP
jgi:RES domain-containing protein